MFTPTVGTKSSSISINLSLRPDLEPGNIVISIINPINIDKTIKGYFIQITI